MTVTTAAAITCDVGEGPLWDHRTGRLHYVDITGKALLTHDPATGFTLYRPMPAMIGFVALTADPGVVIGGLHGGLHTIELASGRTRMLCPVETERPTLRINDGTVAPDGAVVFGTMEVTAEKRPIGSFYRWHKGVLTSLGGAMLVTNGPAFAPDGETVLTADTTTRRVFRHRYADGTFRDTTLFARFADSDGVPDGITFDAAGCAWIGHFGGRRISRWRPDGSCERSIALPASQVTKCCFGGADLTTLYVTTAARGLDVRQQPGAGHLFCGRGDIAGLPANIVDV